MRWRASPRYITCVNIRDPLRVSVKSICITDILDVFKLFSIYSYYCIIDAISSRTYIIHYGGVRLYSVEDRYCINKEWVFYHSNIHNGGVITHNWNIVYYCGLVTSGVYSLVTYWIMINCNDWMFYSEFIS